MLRRWRKGECLCMRCEFGKNVFVSEQCTMSSMNQKLRDQYDSLYTAEGDMYGGGESLKVVQRLSTYINSGAVLDIGGGEGRNALYLAAEGFDVSVTDLSSVGIKKLQNRAKEKSLDINARMSDVLEDGIIGMYDVILMSFMLHHVGTVDAVGLIQEAKEHTNEGGVHIIVTFSNHGGLYKRNVKSGRFYPGEAEMKKFYADWNVQELASKEVTTHARDKLGNNLKNDVVTLMATDNVSPWCHAREVD